MPRKTKEPKHMKDTEKSIKNNKAKNSKVESSTIEKNKKTVEKQVSNKIVSIKNTLSEITKPTKQSTSKKTVKSSNTKKSTIVKSSSKKELPTKSTSTLKDTTIKPTSKSSKDKLSKSQLANIIEYYDLPYRYNQTVVKLLAQTPNTLFIYWDISDNDRENLKKQYGYNFFHKTRPILIIHNDTMNYSFEVEINDFANSWYLHVNDSNCSYRIELGRRPIPEYTETSYSLQEFTQEELDKYPSKNIDRDYFYITISNHLMAPNDHILIEQNSNLSDIQFRNVKTNQQYTKSISSLQFRNNLYDLYKQLYKEEHIEDIFDMSNPSSGNPSSSSFSSQFK